MCTASWQSSDSGYTLLFNRDELRTRKPAVPPAIYDNSNGRYVAPIDADAGGTWIAVNPYGVSCFLLNYYLAESRYDPGPDATSRGLIIPGVMGNASAAGAVDEVFAMDLSRYMAFTFVALDVDGAHACIWDGSKELVRDTLPPLSSSSFKSHEVIHSRLSLYGEKTGETYHTSHLPEKGPFSVCMHRPDARTVSFSRIDVTAENIVFSYAPGNPCETPLSNPPVTLERR